jgi:hypothetical protein
VGLSVRISGMPSAQRGVAMATADDVKWVRSALCVLLKSPQRKC